MTEFYIRDSVNADELSGKDLLSTDSVHKARKEGVALKKERDDMVARRYSAKRIKLRDLLKYTHLTNKDIQFSPKERVEKTELKSEIENVKRMIRRVKSLASRRTHLVLRVELVRKAKSLEDLEVLISNAKSAAHVLKTNDEAVPYDGRDVDDILNIYREQFIAAAHKKAKKKASTKVVPTTGAKNPQPGRTRKGTLYKIRSWLDVFFGRNPITSRQDAAPRGSNPVPSNPSTAICMVPGQGDERPRPPSSDPYSLDPATPGRPGAEDLDAVGRRGRGDRRDATHDYVTFGAPI